MQEELEDDGVVVGQQLLEVVDLSVAGLAHVLLDEAVNAGYKNILVVGAVEDGHHAARGDLLVDAPEEVVCFLQGRRDFERGDVAPLRVNAGHDMGDGAVLARRVQPLQDDQDAVLLRRVEPFLQAAQFRLELHLGDFAEFFLHAARVVGVVLVEVNLLFFVQFDCVAHVVSFAVPHPAFGTPPPQGRERGQ